MKNTDNRVRYTKMVLRQALLQILQTKNIDKVTIKDICDKAEVNRGTFYLHYATPNDLLMEIEQQFVDENKEYFFAYRENDSEVSSLAGMFTCILQNKDICRVIMGKNGSPKFVERLGEMMRENVVDGWCREFPKCKRADLDYVFDYVFVGSTRLILNWIEDDKGLSTEDLALRLDRLGYYCHLAVAEFCGKPPKRRYS